MKKFYHYVSVLCLVLGLCLVGSASVKASSYVKKSETKVSITSKKTGWQQIGKDYYFYDSKGRLLCGSIQYKGYYYLSHQDGRRFTGWITRGGKKYYYNRKNGAMFRSRWATGTKYTYYFDKKGVAINSQWLTEKGKKYYFLSNSTMAKGWQKIGKYVYYFGKKTGAMVTNANIGKYYLNSQGHRKLRTIITESENKYTYSSKTLDITLERQMLHGIPYWLAHIKTASPSQLRSALSYGTYGGERQTTSSAISSNKGIIGVNGSAFDYANGKPSPWHVHKKRKNLWRLRHQLQRYGCQKRRHNLHAAPGSFRQRSLKSRGKRYLQFRSDSY